MFYMRVAHHLTSIGDIGQCWHKLLGQKSTSFIWCIKPCKAFGTVLKYEKKSICGGVGFSGMLQAAIIFQRFPCFSTKQFPMNTYSKICILMLCIRLEVVSRRYS